MGTIVEGIRCELACIRDQLETFVGAFNNDPEFRRVGNCRPRTDLMTRGLRRQAGTVALTGYEGQGFIPRAMIHADSELTNGTEWTWARHVDIGCQAEGWWQGRAFWKWIVEVENNWKELRGTLSDLPRIQACRKLGVFYRPEPEDVIGEVRDAVVQVFEAFGKNGFAEATGARYEVVVLPEVLSADDPSTFRCLHMDFTAGAAVEGLKEGQIVPLL